MDTATDLSLPVSAVGAFSPQERLPPPGPERSCRTLPITLAERGAAIAVGTEGAEPALGKWLTPPACSLASPVNQRVFGSVQREHVLQKGLHPQQVPQVSGMATGSSLEHDQGHILGHKFFQKKGRRIQV